MAKASRKPSDHSASQAIGSTETPSSVFDQPNVAATPAPHEHDSNIIGLTRASNTFETRESWYEAFARALTVFFKEHGDMVANNVLISTNKPTAKRLKDANEATGYKLTGKVAFTYAPTGSSKNYQIFLAAQLDHPTDLALAMAGQLLRTAVWNPEKDKPDSLSKEAKALFTKYGLTSAIAGDGSVACVLSSILLPFVMAKVSEFGPMPYEKIEIEAKDLPKRTATRSAKVWCANEECTGATEGRDGKKSPFTFNIYPAHLKRLADAGKKFPCPHCSHELKNGESEHEKAKAEGNTDLK